MTMLKVGGNLARELKPAFTEYSSNQAAVLVDRVV